MMKVKQFDVEEGTGKCMSPWTGYNSASANLLALNDLSLVIST